MSNIKHITAVVFTLLYPLYIHAQTIEVEWGTVCTESYGCANTTITDVDYVQAMGYKSIYGSSSSITISGECKCFGSHSCGNAYGIASHSSSIICSGSNACSRCSHVEASLGVSGRGANALTYSSINTLRSRLNCYGEHSCAYTQINSISEIHGRGAHSLLFAMIDSVNSIGTLHIYLKGFYSGYGATIRCRSHHNCTIHCTAYTCTSLDLLCDTNATCITKPSFNSSINDPFLVRYYNAFTVSQTNDMACTSSRTFDAFKEMYQYNGSLNNTGDGPLCCRGASSCESIHNINYSSSIICSGQRACYGSTLHTNAHVFCEGSNGCFNAKIYTKGKVYSMGYWACSHCQIFEATHIYCAGWRACQSDIITNHKSNLYLYLLGYEAGIKAQITCGVSRTCYIMCNGEESCVNMNLVCDGTCHVFCSENSGCPIGWNQTDYPALYPTLRPSMSSIPTTYQTTETQAADISTTPINSKIISTLYHEVETTKSSSDKSITISMTLLIVIIASGSILMVITVVSCMCMIRCCVSRKYRYEKDVQAIELKPMRSVKSEIEHINHNGDVFIQRVVDTDDDMELEASELDNELLRMPSEGIPKRKGTRNDIHNNIVETRRETIRRTSRTTNRRITNRTKNEGAVDKEKGEDMIPTIEGHMPSLGIEGLQIKDTRR
eukprot:908569_1